MLSVNSLFFYIHVSVYTWIVWGLINHSEDQQCCEHLMVSQKFLLWLVTVCFVQKDLDRNKKRRSKKRCLIDTFHSRYPWCKCCFMFICLHGLSLESWECIFVTSQTIVACCCRCSVRMSEKKPLCSSSSGQSFSLRMCQKSWFRKSHR